MTRKQRVVNRDVNAVQRAVMAVELRAQRLTYQQIADRVGYASAGACRDAIMRELERCVVSGVETLRHEELDMLNRLHAAVWPRAVPPTDTDIKKEPNLYAVDRILAISERRAKLMGLDTRPDELLTQQNYTKRIILTAQHEQPGGVSHDHDSTPGH